MRAALPLLAAVIFGLAQAQIGTAVYPFDAALTGWTVSSTSDVTSRLSVRSISNAALSLTAGGGVRFALLSTNIVDVNTTLTSQSIPALAGSLFSGSVSVKDRIGRNWLMIFHENIPCIPSFPNYHFVPFTNCFFSAHFQIRFDTSEAFFLGAGNFGGDEAGAYLVDTATNQAVSLYAFVVNTLTVESLSPWIPISFVAPVASTYRFLFTAVNRADGLSPR